MEPVQYNNAKIYCGAVFRFSFRLNRAGSVVSNPDDVIFVLSDHQNGTEVYIARASDSPAQITVDDQGIWTVEIPSSDTISFTDGEMYMQVDVIDEGETEPERWIVGNVQVLQNATSE